MRKLILFIVLFGLWLLLVWSVERQDLIAGAVLALIVSLVFGSVFIGKPKRVFAPERWVMFVFYVPYFLYYCLRANLDVA